MKVEIVVDTMESGVLMKLKGDVDMSSSSDVRSALATVFKQADPGMQALLIDLSQVRYMDSSGIATLVECMQQCMKKKVRLRLVDLSPSVRDVFELARLMSVFEVFANTTDAKAGLA